MSIDLTHEDCYDVVHYHPSNHDINHGKVHENAHLLYKYLRSKNYFWGTSIEEDKKNVNDLQAMPQDEMRITFYNGGVAYVPIAELKNVLSLYAKDIIFNTPMYMNQLAYDDCCRLFVDVDSTIILYEDQLRLLCREFVQTMKAYFDFADGIFPWTGLAYSGPKLKKNNVVSAVHLHTHIKVTLSQLAQITYGFKLRMDSKHEDLSRHIDIDPSVVKTSYANLRTIYARKVQSCIICAKSDMKSCDFCNGTKRLSSKKNYEPKILIDEQGEFDAERFIEMYQVDASNGCSKLQSITRLIEDFSIWSLNDNETYIYRQPLSDPLYSEEVKNQQNQARNKNKNDPREKMFRKRKRNQMSSSFSHELLKSVETFIRQIKMGQTCTWQGINVDQVVPYRSYFHVKVSGLHSKCCRYKGGNHSSNHIYFQIRKDNHNMFGYRKPVMIQMCFNETCKKKINQALRERQNGDVHTDSEHVLYYWKCDMNVFDQMLHENKNSSENQQSVAKKPKASNVSNTNININESLEQKQSYDQTQRHKKANMMKNLKRLKEMAGIESFTTQDMIERMNISVKRYSECDTSISKRPSLSRRNGRGRKGQRINKNGDSNRQEEQNANSTQQRNNVFDFQM